MLNMQRLQTAAHRWMNAVVRDETWAEPLDEMAAAVGAKGSAVFRQSESAIAITPSASMRRLKEDFATPAMRSVSFGRWSAPQGQDGFVAHAAPWRVEAFKTFPVYRDYLLPVVGVAHRAQAVLSAQGEQAIGLTFMRSPAQGDFDVSELEHLDQMRSAFHATVMLAKFKDRVIAEQQAAVYRQRGEFVFLWEPDGRLKQESCDELRGVAPWIPILNQRLTAAFASEQGALDALIGRAMAPGGSSGCVTLTNPYSMRRIFLMAIPLPGEARDVMGEASALGVVIDPDRTVTSGAQAVSRLRAAVGLTQREAEMTNFVAAGLSAEKIAARTGLATGTVRNQIKSAMQKCDVHSQVELSALAMRLR